MVKVLGVPGQAAPPFENNGVTVIVATRGVVPAFVALKEAMLEPLPVAESPMPGWLLVQL